MWQNHYVGDFFVMLVMFSMYQIGHQHLKLVTNTCCLPHPSPTSMSPEKSADTIVRWRYVDGLGRAITDGMVRSWDLSVKLKRIFQVLWPVYFNRPLPSLAVLELRRYAPPESLSAKNLRLSSWTFAFIKILSVFQNWRSFNKKIVCEIRSGSLSGISIDLENFKIFIFSWCETAFISRR